MRGLLLTLSALALSCSDGSGDRDQSTLHDVGPADVRGETGSDAAGADAARLDGGAADAGSLDACFAGVTSLYGKTLSFLEFVATSPPIRLRLVREPGNKPVVGETFAYELIRFGAIHAGKSVCVKDAAALSYDFGHHNWDEVIEARTGGQIYVVRLKYDVLGPKWNDTLELRDAASGKVTLGPLPLKNVGCWTIPKDDLNHCMARP